VLLIAGASTVGAAGWYQFGRDTADVSLPQQVAVISQTSAQPSDTATTPKTSEDAPLPAPADGVAKAVLDAALAPEEELAAVPQQTEAPRPAAPAFDEVRRESDGMTIIAGRAAPGASVSVLLDGQEIAQTTPDSGGKFAAIAMIAPDGQGHVLSLMQNGQPSDEQIILAPIAPVVVAEATPEPTPQAGLRSEAEPAEETDTAAVEPQRAEPDVAEPDPAAPTAVEEAGQLATAETQQDAEPEQTEAPALTKVAQAEPEPAPSVTEKTAPQAVAVAAEPEAVEGPAPKAPVTLPETTQPAAQEVVVLKATNVGVELLNAPSPEVMSNVALDTISYSDGGDVQLAGRAQSKATAVRVYLNNTAVVSLTVDASGRWRGDLPDVDEGIYTLRVDEVSQDGTVTSRVETPFKREAPEVLAAAAQAQNGPIKKITVQKGATLWAIAEQRYGDGLLYVNVFKANRSDIRNPNLIYPGQVFDLPD
jgi:nucleoid-associated protein YgaU